MGNSKTAVLLLFFALPILLGGCQSDDRAIPEPVPASTIELGGESLPLADLPPEASSEAVDASSPDSDIAFDRLGDKVEIYGVGGRETPTATGEELLLAVEEALNYYRTGDFPETQGVDPYPPLPQGSELPASVTLEELTVKKDYFFYSYAVVLPVGGGKEMLMGLEPHGENVWSVIAVLFRDAS